MIVAVGKQRAKNTTLWVITGLMWGVKDYDLGYKCFEDDSLVFIILTVNQFCTLFLLYAVDMYLK